MKSPQSRKLAARGKFPAENGFGGDFSGHFTKSAIADFCNRKNGVVARFFKNKARNAP